MKAKLFNVNFTIDKKGNIKAPVAIKEAIEMVLNTYENSPTIGNLYAYALSETFGENFKIISIDESKDKRVY